jgi:di/tricarboxylate transporter
MATNLNVQPMPFVIAVTVAASAAFTLPLGYQTHLMVYGPGGYRLTDFVRVGLPLNVIVGVITIALIPLVWPF